MRHGSLFSGIGGFDLAAEWMGWENVFHCEWNEFGQKILKHYWPNAKSYEDITKTDFTIHRGGVDIISGGFPCQPFSHAGRRRGSEDERYLWPEMLRVIREVCPKWVIGENVYGLVSWDGGLVFDTVKADLENEGYKVIPVVLPAAGVNAPHNRSRIFFIATNTNYNGCNKYDNKHEKQSVDGRFNAFNDTNTMFSEGDIANTNYKGLQGGQIGRSIGGEEKKGEYDRNFARQISTRWEDFPTVPPICFGDDGFSEKLDGITFSKWRKESLMAAGNAVVPQLVLQIFKTIEAYERITSTKEN